LSKNPDKTTPIDITGWNIKFTVRSSVPSDNMSDDNDALISETATILDAPKGVALIYVKAESTKNLTPGEYWYDMQIIKPVDEYGYQEVTSIRKGKYIILGDITRTEVVEHNTDTNNSLEDSDDGYTI
jgi:hypothetical protein